jgi:tetratricopeptide (TPR) repeat protein
MKPPPPPQADRQFALLLCGKADAKASGILTATRGKLRRLFCLEKGWITFATSNLLEEQFAEYLVRSGALSPNSRAYAVEIAAARGIGFTAILLESGRPPREKLQRGMEGLVHELATSTLEWPDGQFAFEGGLARLDDEITVRVAARSFVIAHANLHPAALDSVRVRIGPPDLRPVATVTSVAQKRELDGLGAYLMERCDGTVDLAELVKRSPAEEEPTLRAIYGYLLSGMLEPEDARVRRSRELRGEAEISREEALGRLALVAGQDHYGVLGVDRTARREAIRESYYSLARRYHPDRFRSGPLSDLLTRFEEFFTRVTEAYNTLWEAESRAEYDQLLAAASKDVGGKGSDTAYLARQNFLRGRALAGQRKLTEAVTFLENAVQLDPAQAEYHLELGLILSRNPRHREAAERCLLQAIELSPTLAAAYVALGQMYAKAGRPGRAVRMAREALRWEPGHLEASEILTAAGNVSADEREDLRSAIFGTG